MLFNFIILLSLYLLVNNNDSCNNKNCFSCIYSNCLFTSTQCTSPQPSETPLSPSISFTKCLSISETCTDSHSQSLLSSHCHLSHNETQNTNTHSYSFWLKPSQTGIFGHANLFCKLELPQLKNQTSLTLYLQNKNVHNQELHPVFMEAISNTSTNQYTFDNKDNYVTLSHINKIVLYYYQISELPSSPFELLILTNSTHNEETKKKEGISIGVYIGIVCAILICLGISILVYCCTKKIYQKKRDAITARSSMRRTSTRRKSKRNTVIAQVNRLFTGELRPIGYSDALKEKGNCCTVCLEKFKKNIKICVTPCGHVFHYKCLYDWLHGNIMNPKCPNCNANLIEREQNGNDEHNDNNVNAITVQRNRRSTYRHERSIPQEETSNNMRTTEAANININTNICNDNLNNKEDESEEVEIESVE